MKPIFILLFTAGLLGSCTGKKIARPEDYNACLKPVFTARAAERQQQELQFWNNRWQQDTGSFVNMLEVGYNYLGLFKLKGRIEDLKTADALIKRAAQKLNNSDPDI